MTTITNDSLGLGPDGAASTPDSSRAPVNVAVSTADSVNNLLYFLQNTANYQLNSVDFRVNDSVQFLNNSDYNLISDNPISPVGISNQVNTLPSTVVQQIQAYMDAYPLGSNYAESLVQGMQEAWLAKFFPAAVQNGIDTLLQSVTQTLVSEAMQEIIWSRARAQVLRQSQAWEDEVVTEWAGRGFALPPGILANQIQQKNQEYNHQIAELAAKEAEKALDIQVDGIKFAADVAVRLKVGLLDGMNGYIGAYSRVAADEMNHNVAIQSSRNNLYSAINSYYDTLVRKAESENRSNTAYAEIGTRRDSVIQQAWSEMIRAKVQTDVTGAQVYAQVTNSALGGLHGVASAAIT
jgi:hypothetical protein